MTNPAVSYPPKAHVSHASEGSSESNSVTAQPGASPSMHSGKAVDDAKNVDRMRGGCIPLPNGGRCWIIPIPCCC
ncbi:hypothetical protein BDV98DRAFT_570969 [Pterulicium gracile]|uniref:Uncharacterized protein n=1 Tax=Pterulicium gracile TaxID=1884261 RepID=A0A5C3QBM3_9AGAR|nr:hypothetical protein BDV98DRAFT_570969 [Pterula gracilis]